jgi:hypothetical protein
MSLSHQRTERTQQKRVWRQLCECLFEAVAHQPPTVSLLLLQALSMQIPGMSFTVTYPCRLCLFRVLLAACPFCFLQYAVLPACYNCSLFLLFRVHIGRCTSPTLQWTVLCFSCFYKPSPIQAHLGGVLPLLPSPAGLFIYTSCEGVPLPPSPV